MGCTGIRQYANYRPGQKYEGVIPADKKEESGAHGRSKMTLDPGDGKAKSAEIFYVASQKARQNKTYLFLLSMHKNE